MKERMDQMNKEDKEYIKKKEMEIKEKEIKEREIKEKIEQEKQRLSKEQQLKKRKRIDDDDDNSDKDIRKKLKLFHIYTNKPYYENLYNSGHYDDYAF